MSIFLERTADTPAFRILEYFLEARETDHAISDVIETVGISRSTFYAAWPLLLKNAYIRRSRTVGKTNLYTLNTANTYVRLYMQLFDAALAEHAKKHKRKALVT